MLSAATAARSIAGCLSFRERVQVGYTIPNSQALDETTAASLRMPKDGTERVNETYRVSPEGAHGTTCDWMRDSLGRFTVEFTASNTDEGERRDLPNRLGGGCYGVTPQPHVRGDQLLVFTGHSRRENYHLS